MFAETEAVDDLRNPEIDESEVYAELNTTEG